MWRVITLAILGFLRCFIQTTLMLVIAEEYKDNFSTAFSISMIISGTVCLGFGLIAGETSLKKLNLNYLPLMYFEF